MADKNLKARIVHKHDTEANWQKATGFIPKMGELIVYDIDSTYGYERFKIGDGATNVNSLPFADAHKVDQTYFQEMVGDVAVSTQIDNAISAIPQADWNQNDTTAADYIENRPFYESITDYTWDGNTEGRDTYGSYVKISDDTPTPETLLNGAVLYDGSNKMYDINAISSMYNDTVFIDTQSGTFQIFYSTSCTNPASGSPFTVPSTGIYYYNSEYTVSRKLQVPVAVKIDKKFIPDSLASIPTEIETINTTLSNKMNSNDPVGTGSFSMGRKADTTIGNCSHAEGTDVTASGSYSHAEGASTTASQDYSHAEGFGTTASGSSSHAEGQYTTASGMISHAEGAMTTASGKYSHAEGSETIAAGNNQHVEGRYNIEDTSDKYAHIVGNGNSDTERSNAHTLDWSGNAWFAGEVKVGGTSQDDASAKTFATIETAAKLFTYKGYIRDEQELETSVTNPSIGDSYSLEDTTVKYWNGSSWVSAPTDVVFSNVTLAPGGYLTFPNTGNGGVCIYEKSTSDTEPILAFYGAAGDETVSLSNVKVPYLDTQINNIYGTIKERIYCHATATSSSLKLSAGAIQGVPLNTLNINNPPGSFMLDVSSNGVRCRKPGTVLINGSVYVTSSTAGNMGVYIKQNSSEIACAYGYNNTVSSVSKIITVAAGDIITLNVRSANAGTCVPNNYGTYLDIIYLDY